MFKTSQSKMLEVVDKMLSDLKVKTKGISRSTACTISKNGKEIISDENTDSDTVSSVSTKKIFDDIPEIKRFIGNSKPMSFTKNWYPRPTPPDMQFEERVFQTQFSVSANKLYEWNIDGLFEQKIINTMSHMSMVPSQFPQILQDAIKGFNGPFVTIRCWSTLPKWERDNWINVQPSKHLILINGHTHQGPWFEGNSQLSFADPFTLAECWRNYFNNQIIIVAHNLWKNYHFMDSTDRISVFGPRPYSDAIANLRVADHCNPIKLLIPGRTPAF